MPADWQARVTALAEDHRSPSSHLAIEAGRLLTDVAREDPELLAEVARDVVRAQPAMAALVNVANVALRAVETLGLESVPKAIAALQTAVESDRRAAARHLAQHLDEPVRVVTHSASAAVIEAIQQLRMHERLRDVVCTESRPILEGTALARWLAGQGIAVTLTLDVALAEYLQPGAIFVAGTDALLPHGVANKCGTRLLATWCRLAAVPSYVLATRDKIYPPCLAACFANPQRPASEVLPDPPEGLRVDNRAFDVTARSVWTAIWVGERDLADAESRGDHAVARGLAMLAGLPGAPGPTPAEGPGSGP